MKRKKKLIEDLLHIAQEFQFLVNELESQIEQINDREVRPDKEELDFEDPKPSATNHLLKQERK